MGYLYPMTLFHVTDKNGLAGIAQHGFRPAIGPRSQRLGEKREAIYFFRKREFVDDAVCGWMGDVFPPSSKLYCLEVELPDHIPFLSDPNFGEIEAIVEAEIPPSSVKSATEI